MAYAKEAAEVSTNQMLPDLEFAHNHYGQADVAMFDFTSMYHAEHASRVIERSSYKLLVGLVGDSLLEVRRCGCVELVFFRGFSNLWVQIQFVMIRSRIIQHSVTAP